MLEWLKRHAWKACIRQKRIGGSNPPLSADILILQDMNNLIAKIAITTFLIFTPCIYASAQDNQAPMKETAEAVTVADDSSTVETTDTAGISAITDSLDMYANESTDSIMEPVESIGFHKMLKIKYIEGSAGFMSFVALALVLGLAFCIERII